MHKAYGFDDDAMLWAGTAFFGGISRHTDGVCGAVSALGIYPGFRYRVPPGDNEKADKAKEEARAKTSELVQAFKDDFGSIICQDLLDIPDTGEEDVKRYMDSEQRKELCNGYVRFVVEKLFKLD